MRILNLLRKYKKKLFYSDENNLLRIEINSQNLLNNINEFKRKFPEKMLSIVLKGNAYGHGLIEIGYFLDKNKNIDFFIVDNIVEAKKLRDFGIKKKIIILGYVAKKSLKNLKKIKNCVLIVNSFEQAKILKDKINFLLNVHIKIDTGMRRNGILIEEFNDVINVLLKNKNIKICGLATHLADADNLINEEENILQIEKWNNCLNFYKSKISKKGIFHFSATCGTKYSFLAENNLIRIGIGLYGFSPFEEFLGIKLKPVLSFFAKIVNIKFLKKGEGIGYNFKFIADKNLKIAIIPCGYYEGIPYNSEVSKGYFYFKNIPLRILGKISMNLTAIDITDIKEEIKLENEIEVFSNNNEKLNSIRNFSKISNLSIYQILVNLKSEIKRIIV